MSPMIPHENPVILRSVQLSINLSPLRLLCGKAFASHAEDRDSNPLSRQTQVVKTGSDSSTAKRSATDLSVMVPRR